jgi:hypothetical protein
MRRVAGLALVLVATGCSDGSDPPAPGGHQLAVAGAGGQAGMGGSAGRMETVDAGAAGATLALSPSAAVDLAACSRVTDDGTSKARGDCFLCCAAANLINSGFFQGSCACASESADGSACASQPDDDACLTCCTDASFRGSSFGAGPPTSCTCHGHTNVEVCAPSGSSLADCAVCCINAGYVSMRIDGGCVCTDG